MSCCCLKYRKNTESINPKVSKTNNGKTMILPKCAVCGSKKSRFIKKPEASEILINLGLKTPLNNISLLDDILLQIYKMNETANKFLLAGDEFMPEMHLKQPAIIFIIS